MNFQFYVEKLFDSKAFQDFMKEFNDAFPCSGFFTIDLENLKNPDNKQNIDYYVPSVKKAFSFKFVNGIERVQIEGFGEKIPEPIAMNLDIDFEEIEDLIRKEMEKKEVKNKIHKMLFSLQRLDGKDFLIGTIFISGMALLKVVIDIDEKKINEFQKSSFFDMMKIVKK